MKRFALFGAGFIGRVHAHNLAKHPEVDFCYLHDVDNARAQKLAEECAAKQADAQTIFNSDVDAVLIASSTNTHADLVKEAIRYGKAVFCEKPIDLDLDRVHAAYKAVEKSGLPNMVGFNRRFDANHSAVHNSVRAGEVGTVEVVQLTARDPVPPPLEYIAVSGGQLRDQVIHFFDLLRWITASNPVEVYTAGSVLVDPAIAGAGDIDTCIVTLRLESGALAHIDCSRRCPYGYDERIEVFGSKGMMESLRQQHRNTCLYQGRNIRQDGLHTSWLDRMKPTYYNSLDCFVRHLHSEDVEVPTFADGYMAQIIAEAATNSLHQKKPLAITY